VAKADSGKGRRQKPEGRKQEGQADRDQAPLSAIALCLSFLPFYASGSDAVAGSPFLSAA
jgi:hypothetical protein